MCSTIILYFLLIIISSISFHLISPDRQFIPTHTVYGLIFSYGPFLWQCCMLICIIFLLSNLTYSFHYGHHTNSCQFIPFYSIIYLSQVWFINNGHCQWFMPNSYHIILFICSLWIWFVDNGHFQWFMPNSYHVILLFVHYRFGPLTMVTISDSCLIHNMLDRHDG